MKINLVRIDEVSDVEIASFRQDFLKNRELIHGSNGLTTARDISKWRRLITQIEKNPPKNKVKTKQFFIVTEKQGIVGVIDFRLYLNSYHEKEGGHIGYSIRPNSRGRGLATNSLITLLKLIKKDNLMSEVLLTCEESNIQSQRVIEKAGGRELRTVTINNRIVKHYTIKIT